MKFEIQRTSEKIPFEGAKRKTRKVPYSWREGEFEHDYYEIEINTLEDLLELSAREGNIIVEAKPFEWCTGLPSIEIYDTWRE